MAAVVTRVIFVVIAFAIIVVFGCCKILFACCCCVFYVDVLLSKQDGRNKQMKTGGQKVEQLPVKIKGDNYVPNVQIMLLFCYLMFVCVLLQKHHIN